MTDEQIERVRADVGRRWGALETAVEDAAVEVDAEGQNGNLVRRAFEETRAAVEGEIEALTASNERLRQERNAAVTAADLAPVYEALEADNEHALAAKVQAAAQTIERLTARLQTAELRIRGLASDDEPPTPADLEAIADLCRGVRT